MGYELEQAIPGADKETPPTSSGSDNASLAYIPEISLYYGEQYVLPPSSTPQRPPLQQRHSIAGPFPSSTDMLGMDTSPAGPRENMIPFSTATTTAMGSKESRKFSDSSLSPAPSPVGNFEEAKSPEKSPRGFNATYPPLLKTSLSQGMLSTIAKSSSSSSSSTSRKKQQKKYRKLRYHEYVPPSKSTPKGGKTNPKPPSKSDSPYSSILQQQQLFLQLQVLQQQYPNGVLMQKLPEMINNLSKEQKALAFAAAKGRLSVTSPSDLALSKQPSIPQILPVEVPNKHNTLSVRFEDLKVNDLKTACKELGMIVSGKKVELVERLMDHNKGVLPPSALPDNLAKDSRRQVFSMAHGSSVDSQFSTSSTVSPNSPNTSPIFKFPADHRGGNEGSSGSASMGKQSSRMQLPEVLPAANLHKEINEMIERQKRNYICQKGMSEKSIAPRPELTELLAIKLPQSYQASSASHHIELQQQQQRGSKGGGTFQGNARPLDVRSQMLASSEKSSRSLPASPKPNSPANTPGSELMDSTSMTDVEARIPALPTTVTSFSNATSTTSMGMTHMHSLGSIPVSGPLVDILNQSSTASSQMGGGVDSVTQQSMAACGSNYTSTSFYQQQQTAALQGNHTSMRPGRSSVPAQTHPSSHHTMGLPSYTSVMRSRSIAGPHPSLGVMRSRLNK